MLRNRGARVSISGWRKVSPGRAGKFSQIPEALEPGFPSCSNSDRKSIGPSPHFEMPAKVLAYAPFPPPSLLSAPLPRLASFSQRYWTFYRVEREEWKVKAEAGNKAAAAVAGNSRTDTHHPWKSSIEAKVSPITQGICLLTRGVQPSFRKLRT